MTNLIFFEIAKTNIGITEIVVSLDSRKEIYRERERGGGKREMETVFFHAFSMYRNDNKEREQENEYFFSRSMKYIRE